jgi:hypothetical protein
MKKLITCYVAIGVAVACFAWAIDTSESKGEAWPVLIVIAAFWPLWLLLYLVFG